MNNTVTLTCRACGRPFDIEYGPGRHRTRYCGLPCKNLARRNARRDRFMERVEQQRAARAEDALAN